MEDTTLEQKINEKISKHRYTPYDLNALLNISKSNAAIGDLFKEFATNEKLLRLLTLHRLDLFGFATDLKGSLLLYCNLPKNLANGEKNNMSNALKHIINEKVGKTEENGLAFLNNAIGDPEIILEDFKDISCYFLISLIRANKNLVDLINCESFDYKTMKTLLKNYENTVDVVSYFENASSNYNGLVDSEIRKKVEKIALIVVENMTSKVEEIMEGFSKITPDLTLYFHKQSIVWLSSILEKTNQDIDEYTLCLDTLFRIKAIENKHIVTWCESCNKHEPSFQLITGKIAPSNLKGKKECIQCQNKKHYSFSAIYTLNNVLKDILNSKDGILATYLTWLLDKKAMSVECSKYAGQYETDILVNKKYLIECKLFRMDKDENAMEINIKKAFTQLKKQILKFKEEGIIIEQAYLLWNLDGEDKNLKAHLDIQYNDLRVKYGFKIISYCDVQEFVAGLK